MTLRYRAAMLIAVVVSAVACTSSSDDATTAGAAMLEDAIEQSFARNRIKLFFDDRHFGPLLHDVEFQRLYRESMKNEADARALMSDPSVSVETKSVAILLMQCLPLDRYVEFVRLIFDETRAGHADPTLLAEAIFPGEAWGDILAMNYQTPRVRDLLEEIRSSQIGDARVDGRISWILDGGMAKYFRDHRADGVAMPAIDCEAPN